MVLRLNLAYGEETDYFDDPNCIGWTRAGQDGSQPIAVLISNASATSKRMYFGQDWSEHECSDYLGNCQTIVTIDEEGWGEFPVEEQSVSVWSIKN